MTLRCIECGRALRAGTMMVAAKPGPAGIEHAGGAVGPKCAIAFGYAAPRASKGNLFSKPRVASRRRRSAKQEAQLALELEPA